MLICCLSLFFPFIFCLYTQHSSASTNWRYRLEYISMSINWVRLGMFSCRNNWNNSDKWTWFPVTHNNGFVSFDKLDLVLHFFSPFPPVRLCSHSNMIVALWRKKYIIFFSVRFQLKWRTVFSSLFVCQEVEIFSPQVTRAWAK